MPAIRVVNKILIHYSYSHFTLYGIFTRKKKIITSKSIKEWEHSKNETKNINSLYTFMLSTTNTS